MKIVDISPDECSFKGCKKFIIIVEKVAKLEGMPLGIERRSQYIYKII